MAAAKALKLERKSNIYLKDTGTVKGRGVFCTTAIKKGEDIEITPALVLNESANQQVTDTILGNYVFTVGNVSKKIRERKKIKNVKQASCVIMGIASFCNHDEKPNAEILWEEQSGSLYYILRATRNIPADTEIVTSYGEGWFEER
jgi:SET domain-containing protein